jgi:beta-lactam-binding protein with PASTA domain
MPLSTRVWSAGKWLVLVGALAATYLIFAAIAMRVAIRAREVQVPNLVGQTVEAATTLAASAGLAVRVDETRRPDANVPAGHVLDQDPAPGAMARRQRTMRLVVSAGARIAVVPELVGEAERAARLRVTQSGLLLGPVAEIRSAEYPPDVVIAQDPAANTATAEVRLLVNRGEDSATYVMPDLIGVSGDRAAEALRSRGFRVAIVAQQSSPGIPPGVVLRQTPRGGYQVHPGDAISLEVSR